MTSVFLSHSNRDKELARRIAVDLKMSGVKVWFDEWEIFVGHSISQRIESGLNQAEFVIVLLSRHGVSSGWVQKEWMSRIGREAESKGVHVLPVLADDCEVPALLKDKRHADMRSDYNRALRELLESLHAHSATARSVTAGARIASGQVVFETIVPPVPLLRGMINTIEAGCFERHEAGLRAHIRIRSSHVAIQQLSERVAANHMTLESLDYSISSDPANPSVFQASQPFTLRRGESITDVATGQSFRLSHPLSGRSDTTVRAIVEDGVIHGEFAQSVSYSGPAAPASMTATGTFRAVVEI